MLMVAWLSRIPFCESKNGTRPLSATLLVCVKNDSANLAHLLAHLTKTKQFNDSIEVLIIDDYSSPAELSRLEALRVEYKYTMLRPSVDILGKKQALFEGMRAVRTEAILLTDADTLPRKDWVSAMLRMLEGNDLVLGYSPMLKAKGTVNAWSRFEGLVTALQYSAFAHVGNPYMGVGRSMALRRAAFADMQLADLVPNIASGDDDMLVKYAGKAAVCIDQSASVDTHAQATWKGYFHQKRRQYSIATHYSLGHILALSLFSVTQVGILVFGLVAGIFGNILLVASICIGRWILLYLLTWQVFRRLQHPDLWKWLPLLDIGLGMHYFYFSFSFLSPSKSTW